MSKTITPDIIQKWALARKKYRLSHMHVAMAYELGLNPGKLGSIANNKQEQWKSPLPEFIEHIYEKRFGRVRAAVILPLAEKANLQQNGEAERREAKKLRREQAATAEVQEVAENTVQTELPI